MSAKIAVAAVVAALWLGAGSATARAAGWTCTASAARIAAAGQTVEPVVAGAAGTCTDERREAPLPAGLTSGALTARTAGGERAESVAGVQGFRLRIGPELGIALPAPALDAVPAITLPPLPPLDIRPALRELLRPLPALDLVTLSAATATATASCRGTSSVLDGSSSLSGLAVAGQAVPLDGALTRTVELFGAYAIDPSDIDPAAVTLPGGGAVPAPLRPALATALNALPDITVPAAVADVDLVPGERLESGGQRTQRALRLRASVAGTQVADAVLAEATAGGGACADAATPGSVADLALQCASQPVVLIDVLDTGRRVSLTGVAARGFVGRRVAVRLASTGRVVARPLVGGDGTFRATAPLPPRRIRFTNRARYQAAVGGERSMPLKLSRRMVVTRTTATASAVTLRGRVVGPRARGAHITVKRRVSCERWGVVRRVAPGRDGRFSVRIPNRAGAASAVYRLQTTVSTPGGRPKPTFTLPRYVAFG